LASDGLIEELTDATSQPSPLLKSRAAGALIRIGKPERGVGSLIEMLAGHDPAARLEARCVAEALGERAQPMVPGLIGLLETGERDACFCAVSVLGSIGPGAGPALPALRSLLSRHESQVLQRFAAETITKIQAQSVPDGS